MNIPKEIRDMRRFKKIADIMLVVEGEHFFSKEWSIAGISVKRGAKSEADRAVSLRKGFEKLGGTFIKLGQLLSLRPDLISEAYCDELGRLQDSVTPFKAAEAKRIVAKELKMPLSKAFKSFEGRPIAAASIGQVHRAVLKDGSRVVVKVQRPGIKDIFETDIEILSFIAEKWEKHANLKIVRPTQIVKEFEYYTQNEMDYINEARNIERFRENFKSNSRIIIPKVYWQHTTERVLVMEEIQGKRIDTVLPKGQKARAALMQDVAHMVFKQIFEDGIFHADPHPGNIFLTKDGKIALLDFGIIGFLDDELQAKMTDLFIAMIGKDLKGMTSAMTGLGMVDSDLIDERALETDLHEYLGKYYGTELEVVKMGELFGKLVTIARKHDMVLPSNFVLFGKSMITLEGLGEHIDPHFNFVECAKPYVETLVKRRKGPKAFAHRARRTLEKLGSFFEEFPEQAGEIVKDVKRADHSIQLVHKDLEALTVEMDRSSNRMVLGIVISGCIVGGALLAGASEFNVLGIPIFPLVGFAVAIFLGLILFASIRNEKKFN